MVESFNEVKGESFYSSPPYIYRPSLAQYLSTFSVDKRGFVSEILHLDYINKIHILEMSNEFIRVKLKNKNGLDTSELYVYEYLENNLDFDKNSIVYFSKISKLDVLRFGLFVRGKYLIQFGKSNKSESPKNVSESFFNFFLSFQVMITTFIFAPTFLLSLWFLYIIFLNPVSKIITDHLLMFVFGGLFLAVGWFLVFIEPPSENTCALERKMNRD